MEAKNQEIVQIEIKNPIEVYTTVNGLDSYLEPLKKYVESFHGDASTEKGRKEIKSFCWKLARSKTHLDNMGKELVSELKKQPKKIDEERRRVRSLIDQWSDDCRRPLTEYENREKERINKINEKVVLISNAVETMKSITSLEELEKINERHDELKTFDAQEFEDQKIKNLYEFKTTYEEKKKEIIITQEKEKEEKRQLKEKQEKEAIELKIKLEEQRKKAEKERVEHQKQMEEKMAKIEEAQQEAEKERKKAEELFKKDQERLKEAEKIRQDQVNKELLTKNKDHKKEIMIKVFESIKNILDEESAKKITKAIIKGDVERVFIDYSFE